MENPFHFSRLTDSSPSEHPGKGFYHWKSKVNGIEFKSFSLRVQPFQAAEGFREREGSSPFPICFFRFPLWFCSHLHRYKTTFLNRHPVLEKSNEFNRYK